MKKLVLVSSILSLVFSTSVLNANEFDLKSNMIKLNAELNLLHQGLITSDEKTVQSAIEFLQRDVSMLLGTGKYGNKDNIINILPKDMKNKKHKANIAAKSARKMESSAQKIKEAIDNKAGLSIIKRQKIAQEAYLDISRACYECHNLVRDKERFK